jgi:hypothetical protein
MRPSAAIRLALLWRTNMRIKRYLAALGILLGLGFAAYAQTTVINQAPGPTDTVNVAVKGPGGTGYPTTIQALRNAAGYTLIPATTTANTSASAASAMLIAIGAITTWNITLPPTPFDGERVEVTCPGGTVTTVNLVSALGVAPTGTSYTSCTSGGAAANNAEFSYSTSTAVWYRIN